jgi:signal transduction histidine kinase
MIRLDQVVRTLVLSPTLVRVKLWTTDGQVIYSDERRLIGQRFGLDDSGRRAVEGDTTIGEVSDLNEPENVYERSDGQLLEIYRPVHTPAGRELVFEAYSRYNPVLVHSGQIWEQVALITVGSLLLMHVLWVPLSWVLVSRLSQARRQRDVLIERALSASTEERRRIAGALHDGVVQELVATSFVVATSARQADADPQLATRLETAAAGVRASIGALRSLLVDIYPPNLSVAGLSATLADLATAMRTRGMEVYVLEQPGIELDPATQTLFYRVAQECLRNAERHGQATEAMIRIMRQNGRARLEVVDNGTGFDPEASLAHPAEGHFGLQVMRDLAAERGALLAVRSRPGSGTRWVLEVTVDAG